MGLSKSILNDNDRTKLDGIVSEMIANKEPEENIRFVVEDFKTKYSVKKKESPLGGTGGDGLSQYALDVSPEQEAIFQDQKKKYERYSGIAIDGNDPVGSAKKAILSTVKKPRITSASGISSTGVKRPMEEKLAPIQPEEKGVSFAEASKDLKAVENYYRYNTNRSVNTLSKITGLNKGQLYSDAYDDQIKQSIQPGNTTQSLAYEALQDAKKANRVIQGGGTIEDMAIRLAGENDPMIKKQIEGQSDVYALEGDMFGKGTKGRLMADMFNNPAFQQEIKNNPALAQEFKQESANLAKNYPEFGKAHYGQIISQKMEDMGINNGILNVVTKGEFDSVVKKLKEEGQITLTEESFINENLRSDTGLKGLGKQIIGRENISTPGLIENTLQGGFTGLENLGKGVAEITGARDIIQGEEQALKTDVERANTNVDVKTKGWHEVTQQGGKFLGQSLSIGGGGGLIKALKIAKNPAVVLGLSGGIQAYANYAPEARMLFPGEVLKQRGYATVMSGIEALTENIFRDDKVVKGLLKDFKPLVRETIQDFTAKKIGASAAEDTIESGIKKIVSSYSKSSGQNVAEEFIAGALGQITQGVFQGKPMSEWIDAEDLAETVRLATIGSPFIAAIATRADFMKNRGITSKQVYMMARDPEYYSSQMQEMAKLDEDLANELPDKLQNLQYATELLNELDSQQGLTEKQKAKFLLTSLDSKIKEQNKSTKTDPILKAKEDAESFMAIQENNKIKQDIIEGKDDGTYEGDTSDEMSKEEIAAAKILAKANLPGMYDEMAEENPIGVLQEIAQQAQGIDKEGNELEGGGRRQDLIYSGVPENVIDEAVKLYPKPSTPMQDQEGATKGVVPSTLENVIEKGKAETNNYEDFKKEKNITDADIKTVPISDVGKYSAIDRNIEGQRGESAEKTVGKLANSIDQFGLTTPIHIKTDGKNSIIEDGETRLAALNKLGVKDVPVYVEKVESFSERDKKLIAQQQSTPTKEAKETTQDTKQAEKAITEPAKSDKAGGEAKKSVLERPIEEVTIEDILKEMEGDEGLAFKEVSNKDIKEGDGKDIEAYNQRAERVLKTLYPNAEFKALSTTKEYEQATGRRGEAGVLIRGKEGKHKLFLNLEAIINSDIERTATHEVVHALVSDAIGAKYVDLRKKWDSLLPKLYKVKGFEIVKEHIEKYSSADRPVEGITDLLANIVHGKIKIEDVPKNLWDEFIELVNRAFEAIGVDYKITPDTFNGFASSVKEAFETGDFRNLKKFTSKSKTEKFFKEYPEFAESASAMIDPERRKQLEEILKTKIQQELNQGKISQDQANEFYRRAGIEPPTLDAGESKKRKFENNPKAILNKVYDSENISESVKRNFRDRGLRYSPQSHEQARAMAREIIDDFGVEDSVAMAEAGRFDGDVNSMIFAEGIDRTFAAEQSATTSDEKIRFAEQWADYTIRYDEAARQKGRFISAIYDFYRKSPLGVILSERRKRDEAFQEWFDKREKPYKEVFDALQEEPEFKEILKQKVETQLKQERAVSRMKRRKKISDIFDSAKLKGDQLSASIIPPPIWNATIEVMKQATLSGESIVNVIQQGVDHIKNNYAEAWDEKTFKAEWEEKLSGIDREGKMELTTEEKKRRILDKFRKKLSGLTEEQKEEVIRKSFKKLVEAGALEYDEFKRIVANVIGLGELTAEETTKLTGFIKDMNAVQDLSDALLKDETKENLKKFNEGVRKSEESATKLAGMLYTQPKVAQRLRSIIQLNTLGVVSLIKNPFYNIFHQALVRLPKGVVMTILDQSIYGASVGLNKAFGTPIVRPDVNILLGQKGYWGKGAKGGAEAVKQVFTGLTNKDYFQKEVYNSQIKPFTAWRDLWAWGKGKKNLTGGQITDKALQATIGIPAEGVARLLNIGDKPFRFAAEAAIAETIGRQQLGLKGFELEVFMRIPKEKAKAIYKKRGLSEEEANKKAELVEKRIIAEGEEAVFQQNNIVADVINKVKQALPSGNENHPLSSFGSGAIKMVGLLNMPFVKTPANIAWEVFNLVNPEFAMFQSLAYGIKAAKTNSQADFLRAKKWMAHAATGWALLGAAGYLASIGAVSGDDEDEPYKAKESKGKGSYEKPHSVNISKVLRAPLGGSIETEDDDLNVDLSWFGAMGMIMNMQANKYENLTKEERESMTYVDDVMFRLNRGAQDGLVNSVFQGSLTAVDALRSGRHDQWLLGMLNVGMNAVEPATLAQISRATRPAEYKITGDDLSETMMNNLKARSFGIFGNPKTKVNIWGEPMNREGSVKDVTLRMLGISQSDTDKFARPIFEDFKRTGDASFFPPSVSPKITVDGQEKKLSSEELLQYEALIGQARKNLVAPFINNKATVKVGKKKMKYTAMDDKQKAEALKKLYGQGFNAGKKLFVKLYPEYEKD